MIDYAAKYDFPSASGKVPMANQKLRFNFLLNNVNAFDLSDMGTGKTHTAIWAADYLCREAGGSVLILAGKTTLQTVWEKSCDDILNDTSYCVLSSVSNNRSSFVRKHNSHFYITNYECLLSNDFRQAVIESDVHTIIIDECTAFKHGNTKRSRFLREIAFGRNVWGLTATPRPNSPLDCHGIARAIRQNYRESFNAFRNRTHQRVELWKWVAKSHAEEAAKDILQPSIRIKREECYELPPCTTERRIVKLSQSASKLFKQLKREAFAELTGNRIISAAHEAALRNKLLQVCGGAIYTEGELSPKRGVEHIDSKPRLNEVLELLEQTNEKLVVFVPYRSQLLMLEKELKNAGHSVVSIHGDIKGYERGRIIEAFQSLRHPRCLVCDPRTMSHGVELTAASLIAWWLPVDSNETYQQAIGRLMRRGQARHVKVIQLCSTALEAIIYDRLEARQSLQGSLLQSLEKEGNYLDAEKSRKEVPGRKYVPTYEGLSGA